MNIIKFIILAALYLTFSATVFAQENNKYFLKYSNSNTNHLVLGKQFSQLTKKFFGNMHDKYLSNKNFLTSNTLIQGLGGSPDEIQFVENRYIVATACRAHSCEEKGFVIIDSKTNDTAYALVHYSMDWSNKTGYNKNGYLTVFFKEDVLDDFKKLTMEKISVWQSTFISGSYAHISSIVPQIVYVK